MKGNFVFDGKTSEEFGIMACYFSSISDEYDAGLKTELDTVTNLDGSETFIINNNYKESITFTLEISKNPCSSNKMIFTKDELRAIVSWLCNPVKYCEFQINEEFYSDETFYVIMTNPKYKIINGEVYGLSLTVNCNHPYGLSAWNTHKHTINGSGTFMIRNYSDESNKSLYPESIEIHVSSACDITIRNDRESEYYFTKFTGCNSGEVITMNSSHKTISTTSSSGIMSRFNKNWIRLAYGINNFSVTGDCTIIIRFREVRKVGVW